MPGVLRTARLRRLAIAGAVLAVAVLLGALIGGRTTSGFAGRYTVPSAGAPIPAGAAGPLPPPVAATPPRPAPPPPPVATDVADAPPVDEDADRIADAIDRATRKALRRGEPVRWHKAGERGYVTVSEPVDDGERLCRNVSATIESDDGAVRSSTHLWCSADGDDWEPVE